MEDIPQAGALCYRIERSIPMVLLVRARRNPSHWIFPKGHVEPGETVSSAALRELLEEAGVIGTIGPQLGDRTYERDGLRYRVTYFLVRWTADATIGEAGRFPGWYTVEEARAHLSFDSGRELLTAAVPYFR